jgi:signal transduction histidine kinase
MQSKQLSRLKWGAWLGYAVVIGTLVVPSGLAFFAAVRAAATRDDVSATYALQAARAERLRSLGLELGLNVRALLIQSDPAAAEAVSRARRDLEVAVLALRAAAGLESQKQLGEIEQSARDYEAAAARVVASAAPRASAFEDELAPLMTELRERLDAYVVYKHDVAQAANVSADATFKRAIMISSVAFFCAVGLGVVLAALSARRLDRDYRRERDTAARAERALAARDELLAIVAHDLRSPLSAITMKAALLRKNPHGDRVLKHVEGIENIAMRMETLVRMLLDAASMEAGRFEVAKADCRADAILRETLDVHSTQAEAKAIRLEASVAADPSVLTVLAERERVIQALSNLIDNAIKFSPREGRVTVTLRAVDCQAVFEVDDDGAGVAAEHLAHVFDRFWRAEVGGKRGAGLGLYIVKGIVDAHGGRVWAENRPAGGGRFCFTLPLASGRQRPMAPPVIHEGAHAAT